MTLPVFFSLSFFFFDLIKYVNFFIFRSYYTGIGIYQLMGDCTLGPEKEIHGLPDGAKINFVSW